MDLAKLQSLSVPLPIPIGDETLTVRYYPNRFTAELTNAEGSIADALETLLADTGLTENGEPVPVKADDLNRVLGIPVLKLIWRAIWSDNRPNLTSPANSDATS